MARRPGLGRGLDALIPSEGTYLQSELASEQVTKILIENITANPQQPRKTINLNELESLASSIKEHGVIQPVIVSKSENNDQYTLIAGERRWRAAKIAGLQEIPALIRSVTLQEQLELALIENIQREDLNPIDRATAFQHLIDQFSYSHDEIAKRVGKSRVSITNNLRLLNLPAHVQNAIKEGLITEGHGRALLMLDSEAVQLNVLASVLTNGYSVRETEALVNKHSAKKRMLPRRSEKSFEIQDLENRLRTHLKTKVNIQSGKDGGKITIFYYSAEELNSILDQLFQSE